MGGWIGGVANPLPPPTIQTPKYPSPPVIVSLEKWNIISFIYCFLLRGLI